MSSGLPREGDDPPVDIFTGRPILDRRPDGPDRKPLWQLIIRHRRWAALLVAALVAGVTIGVVRHGTDAPVAVAPQPTLALRSAPAPAIVPHDAAVTSLPWSTVGPGWTALIWQTVQGIDSGSQRRGLYLVSPAGVRYRVGDSFGGTVLDVSPDGRRILVSTGAQPATSVIEFEVATGTSHSIALAKGVSALGPGGTTVRYTRPSADALLVSYSGTGTAGVVLERRGLDGVLQQRFPPIFDGVVTASDLPLPTPDGRGILLSTTTGLALVDTTDGAVAHRFPLPLATASCTPRGWWAAGVAVVRCDASGSSGRPGAPSVMGPVSDIWAIPVDGSRPRRLTTADGSMQVGYVNGWSTAIGTVAQEGFPPADPCTASRLDVVTADGTRTLIEIPVAAGGADATGSAPTPVLPLAVQDRWAYVLRGGCGRPSALVAYDLVAATAHPLTGAGVDGGTVVSAVTIGRED